MKQREKKRRKSKVSPLVKLLVIVVLGAGLYFFASSSFFDVAAYEVKGNSYYSKDEILTMGNCKTGGNIFWGSGCKDMKQRLQRDAYMEEVKVKRILPDTIRVELTERKQLAAVVYGENYVVIDKNATVLRKTKVEPQLTLIYGLTISKLEVGQLMEAEQKVQLRQTLEMLGTMESYDMYFTKIEMSKAGVKAYVLDYLVCEGTPQNLMESMKTGNLQKVIKGLFDQNIERGTVKVSGDDYISFSPEFD